MDTSLEQVLAELAPFTDEENCTSMNDFLRMVTTDYSQLPITRAVFGCVYATQFLLAFALNGRAIQRIVARRKASSSQTSQIILQLNVFIADLVLCVVCLPLTPTTVFAKSWYFGTLLCKAGPYVTSVTICVTAWTLMFMAIDRYVHIAHEQIPPMSQRQALWLTATMWGAGAVINIPYALAMQMAAGADELGTPVAICGHFCVERWPQTKQKQLYSWSIAALQFIAPSVVITFCYWRISRVVGLSLMANRHDTVSSPHFERQRARSLSLSMHSNTKRRVNSILVLTVCTFVLCWMPMTVVNIVNDLGITPALISDYHFVFQLLVHSCAMLDLIFNPLLLHSMTSSSSSSGQGGRTQYRGVARHLQSTADKQANMTLGLTTIMSSTPQQQPRLYSHRTIRAQQPSPPPKDV